jgi:hypothetical protein
MEIQDENLGDAELRFIDEVAALLEPWGMALSAGRLYAYLLLADGPTPIEKIAGDLQMSRSGAWNAARVLEGFGHVRRRQASGSKRALYFQSDNYAAPMLQQTALLVAMGSLLRHGASTIAHGDTAIRMRRRADFYLAMRERIEAAIGELIAADVTVSQTP